MIVKSTDVCTSKENTKKPLKVIGTCMLSLYLGFTLIATAIDKKISQMWTRN